MKKHRVVIVGGGFGGVRAALDLACHTHDLDIVLIDRDGLHTYPGDFYELISSARHTTHPGKKVFYRMLSSVAIPLADIFENKRIVELMRDDVTAVEPSLNEVVTARGTRVRYDALILAPGSVTNFYGIPGLASRAIELKTPEDALNIRNAIDEAFARTPKNEKISIVVGGGGFSGVEIAGELSIWITHLARIHGRPMEGALVTVIEGGSALMMSGAEWFRKRVEERLRSLGTAIILSDSVVGARNGTLDLKSGKAVPFHVLIWTAGVRAHPLMEKVGSAKLAKGGCVIVDPYLRIDGLSNVFAVGDAAFCKGFDDQPLPMTAQTAISQGEYAAYVAHRLLTGRPFLPYRPVRPRFIAPVGRYFALADIGFMKLSGRMPWVLKRLVALRYFWSILSAHKALRVWWRDTNLARM